MSCCCSMDLEPGTLLERLTMGPDIMFLLLLYSMAGRIMDGCPVEPAGLALEQGMPQSPDPPMGDLCGTTPLFIGPGTEDRVHPSVTEQRCGPERKGGRP